ncbi:MAG TPA: VWA domain-containing protein [Bacillota bacterium]|nr:VWA domain-containing protein [Bacillota bacterium]
MAKKVGNISEKDFGSSTKRRLPICFCLDVSGSMSGNPINELNDGLQSFFSSIRENDETRSAADICIVTFGGSVDIFLPFGKITKSQTIPRISATTSLTPIGEGILTALELLNVRKTGYKELGIKYYQPWLVVITDGAPQGENSMENMEKAIQAVTELESNDRLVVFNIGVGNNVDFSLLKRLSDKRAEPISIQTAQFGKLFAFLGSSSSSVVTSGMKDDALYDLEQHNEGTSVAMDDFFRTIEECK